MIYRRTGCCSVEYRRGRWYVTGAEKFPKVRPEDEQAIDEDTGYGQDPVH